MKIKFLSHSLYRSHLVAGMQRCKLQCLYFCILHKVTWPIVRKCQHCLQKAKKKK